MFRDSRAKLTTHSYLTDQLLLELLVHRVAVALHVVLDEGHASRLTSGYSRDVGQVDRKSIVAGFNHGSEAARLLQVLLGQLDVALLLGLERRLLELRLALLEEVRVLLALRHRRHLPLHLGSLW